MDSIKINETKQALCLEELGKEMSAEKIKEFTKDINLKDYLVCKHKNGLFCSYGITYADVIMCNCDSVINLQRNIS